MNKLISKIVGVALGLSLAAGTGVAIGVNGTSTVKAAAAASSYIKETSSVSVGDTIVLANGSVELSGITGGSTKYGGTVSFTTNPVGAFALSVVAGNATGSFALKNGSNYLTWTSGNSLNVATSVSNNSSWTITFSNGTPTIKNVADASRVLKYNSGSPRFACYTSGQNAVDIYKLTDVQEGAVTGVALDKSFELVTGTSVSLTATISPADATNKNVSWTSSDTSVATVSSSGVVTKVSNGYSLITVTTEDGSFTASCKVMFVDHLGNSEENALTASDAVVVAEAAGTTNTASKYYIGGEVATKSMSNYTSGSNTYRVAGGSISDGTNSFNFYRLFDEGTGNVGFSDDDKFVVGDEIVFYGNIVNYNSTTPQSAYANLVSVIGGVTLTVSPETVNLEVGGESSTLTATLTNASDVQNISWSTESGNENTVELSANSGASITVTGVAAGSDTINVVYGQLTKTVTVNVTDPMSSNEGTINFGTATGATQINGTSVTGNDNLNRTWTITTVMNEKSFTQQPTYSQIGSSSKPATSITMSVSLGDEYNVASFSAKFGGFNGTAGDISLKVDSTEVANGSLNASSDVIVSTSSTSSGSALSIEVTNIAKGVKVYYISYTITKSDVTDIPVESVSIGNDISIAKGNKQQLEATVLPADATNKNVTWSSSNAEVATVNESGLITAIAEGTANITCSSVEDSTINDTIQVTVTAAVLKSLTMASVNKAFILGATLESHFTSEANIIKAVLTDGTQVVKTLAQMSLIRIGGEEVQKNHLMAETDAGEGKKIELTYSEGEISVKYSITDFTVAASTTADGFALTFLDTLSTGTDAVCDANGNTEVSDLQAAWELLAESYAALSSTDKSVFENATASESGSNIEKAVALYDYIGSKYNTQLQSATLTDYNFMSRAGAANANNHISPIANMNNNGLIIVVITAFVGVTFIGGYFFLRKKKEN